MQSPVRTLADGIKPRFLENFPTSLSISESEVLEIEAKYEGKPEPSIKWYHDGVEVIENNNIKIIFDEKGGTSKLLIRKPKAGLDDGIYSCHIENEAGHAVEETIVNIDKHEVRTSLRSLFRL